MALLPHLHDGIIAKKETKRLLEITQNKEKELN